MPNLAGKVLEEARRLHLEQPRLHTVDGRGNPCRVREPTPAARCVSALVCEQLSRPD